YCAGQTEVGYRQTVRSAGKSHISDGTACKSVARVFSGASRLFAVPQTFLSVRRSGYRARRGNQRHSFSRLCQTTAVLAPRQTPRARRPPAPASKTAEFF